MKKVTIQAPADIAFIKYWGNKNAQLRLPENGSISMTLAGLTTTTTVEFDVNLTEHDITIAGSKEPAEVARAAALLDVIRHQYRLTPFAKVVSENNFPKSTGLSSSSSAFAALAVATAQAADLDLSTRELSILARQGSGSACRCVPGGFVEWLDGETSEDSYAVQLFPASHWDIRDVVVVVDEGSKRVSTTEGHKSAQSSVFYEERQRRLKDKLATVKQHLAARDFTSLGEVVEAEALEFHSILLTSQPPLLAWYPGTVEVMQAVQQLRREGIAAYFTINTGFNVHVLTVPEYEERVGERMAALPLVRKTIRTQVGTGPQAISAHLF